MTDVFVHPQAINDSDSVGSGTRIWAFAHVMKGAQVGGNCNLGEGVFVENGAVLGSGVTIKNNVSVWSGVTLEDHVFVGPAAVFTNDRAPRSHPDFKSGPAGWEPTRVCYGASIGANATIVCGTTLGRWCLVAAGAVVTKDVEPHGLVVGNPARQIGWACKCGRRLPGSLVCSCALSYRLEAGHLVETTN